MKWLLIIPIRVYQVLAAPFLGPCCRFSPSCSHYAIGALHRHGLLKGTWLTLRRVLRCQPFADGGYDPVPGAPDASEPVGSQ